MVFRPVSFGGIVLPVLALLFYIIYRIYPMIRNQFDIDACEWLLVLMYVVEVMWAVISLNKEYRYKKATSNVNYLEVFPSRFILVVGSFFIALDGLFFTHFEKGIPFLLPFEETFFDILSSFVSVWLMFLAISVAWMIVLCSKAMERYYGVDEIQTIQISSESMNGEAGHKLPNKILQRHLRLRGFSCFTIPLFGTIVAMLMWNYEQFRTHINEVLLVLFVLQLACAFSFGVKIQSQNETDNKNNKTEERISSHLKLLCLIGGIVISIIGMIYTCKSYNIVHGSETWETFFSIINGFNAFWLLSIAVVLFCIFNSGTLSEITMLINLDFGSIDERTTFNEYLKNKYKGSFSGKIIPLFAIVLFLSVYLFLPFQLGIGENSFAQWVDGVETLLDEYNEISLNDYEFQEYSEGVEYTDDTQNTSSPLEQEISKQTNENSNESLHGKKSTVLQDIVSYSLILFAASVLFIAFISFILKIVPSMVGIFWDEKGISNKPLLNGVFQQYDIPMLVMIAAFSFLRVFNGRQLSIGMMKDFIELSFYLIAWMLIILIALDAVRLIIHQCTKPESYLRRAMHSIYCVMADVVFRGFMSVLSAIGMQTPSLIRDIFTVFLYSDESSEKYEEVNEKLDDLFLNEVELGETRLNRKTQIHKKTRKEWNDQKHKKWRDEK